MHKMKKCISKENILEEHILIIHEYPKKETSLSKLSLFYNYSDGINVKDNIFPSISHYVLLFRIISYYFPVSLKIIPHDF